MNREHQSFQESYLRRLEIEIQEQMQCIFDKDGGLTGLDIMGLFAVNATQEEATQVQLVVNTSADVQFRVHFPPWRH